MARYTEAQKQAKQQFDYAQRQVAARGIEQQINHIADDLDETRLEILKLYENSCWD